MSYFCAESGLSCFPSSTCPHVKTHSYANDESGEKLVWNSSQTGRRRLSRAKWAAGTRVLLFFFIEFPTYPGDAYCVRQKLIHAIMMVPRIMKRSFRRFLYV